MSARYVLVIFAALVVGGLRAQQFCRVHVINTPVAFGDSELKYAMEAVKSVDVAAIVVHRNSALHISTSPHIELGTILSSLNAMDRGTYRLPPDIGKPEIGPSTNPTHPKWVSTGDHAADSIRYVTDKEAWRAAHPDMELDPQKIIHP